MRTHPVWLILIGVVFWYCGGLVSEQPSVPGAVWSLAVIAGFLFVLIGAFGTLADWFGE